MFDEQLISQEFPQDDDLIYLNHAAVAPWPKRTAEAVIRFAEENIHSGALHYARWSQKEAELREQLQRLINASSVDEIAILKNTSEALSVVAAGINWSAGDNVVSTNEEFPSNRIPWEAQTGVEFREVNIRTANPEEKLMEACDAHTRVLSISSVQFGSGIRLDLEALGAFCRKRNIFYCIDAIQSIGAHQFDVQASQADFAMADAHKWMLGPEGIALFYCHAELLEQLQLYQYGWHMVNNAGDYDSKTWQPADNAKRFECGTPNMLGIHALSASLSLFEQIGMTHVENAVLKNSAYMLEKLSRIKNIKLLTPKEKNKHAGIVTVKPINADAAVVYRQLMEQKVVCAHRGGGIRFSPHFYTHEKKLEAALDYFSSLI